MKFKGDKKLKRQLDRLRRTAPYAMTAAILQVAGEIFAESQEEVPVDTGRLRASGVVAVVRAGRDPLVRIGYGTDYGLYVHEDPTKRHGPEIGRGVGQKYKYLEDPFLRAMPTYARRVAAYTRRNIDRGIWNVSTGEKMKGEKKTEKNKNKKDD